MSSSTPSPAPPNIGDRLKVARLDRRLSLEESAWRTRIRPDLLRALEDDAFEELGHEAFVRSHLTSYARFLGIDAGELIEQFDALRDEPAPSAIEELDRKARSARKPPRPRWLLAALVSIAVLVAAAVVGILGGQAERPAADPLGAPTVTGSQGPVPPAEARVRLRVHALAETQLSVSADGAQIFEGILQAGQVRFFRARDSLEILAANGGAIELAHNGTALGVAGEEGAIYRARFGPPEPTADPAG